MTFEEFMGQKYTEAAEYSAGVTREQQDLARDAWETATLVECEACALVCDVIARDWWKYSAKSKNLAQLCIEAIRERSRNA